MSRNSSKNDPQDSNVRARRSPPGRRQPPGKEPPAPPPPPSDGETPLGFEARSRYLTYALSVITSRALPDVRDGLKPVQRRILYTMRRMGLTSDAQHTKSARIVGEVMGKYHPHGDSSIYEAMVRLAQDWVMRVPLVDPQGNFGSRDDGPAAFRYTEAKLRAVALELMSELDRRTVAWRPTYDGALSEPVVLPARFPHLLVNGSQGIAVGMATSIPPHNLGEVIDACTAQIDAGAEPLAVKALLKYLKGPDFPTGGQLFASRDDLTAIYETGSGTLKLRAEYRVEEKKGGGLSIVLTSLPYGASPKQIHEKIEEIISAKKLAPLVEVRNVEAIDEHFVLELKRGSDPQLVMAYLYKNTPLQTTVAINLTCLVPSEQAPDESVAGVGSLDDDDDPSRGIPEELVPAVPERLSLPRMIRHFLDFRMLTVQRALRFDLAKINRRIHILEGFAKVFDALDETIRIIRKSEGKADAAGKLMKRFAMSDAQVEAILELKLYRLARLEILVIQEELEAKQKEARALEALLKSDAKRWTLIKGELLEIKTKYGDKRKTKIVGATAEPVYAEEDFIADEDANVLLTQQGWLKRVREIKDISATRTREGDTVLAAVAGSTRSSVAFFSSLGTCYVMRIHDVPSTTGYGEPIQKFFKLADGEKILTMLSFDPRALDVPAPIEGAEPAPPYAIGVTRGGLSFRFSLSWHREASNRAGRKYGKLNDDDELVLVAVVGDRDGVILVTSDGRALGIPVSEIGLLGGIGKGSMAIKLAESAKVVGAQVTLSPRDAVTAETTKGKTIDITYQRVAGRRAQEGEAIARRDGFARIVPPPPAIPSLENN